MIANIGVRLSPQEKESLAAIAKRTDTTISQIMRRLIRTFITMQGEEEAAADDVRRDIPEAVQKEVTKQVGHRKVGIEIDKQSLAKAKAAIKDLFDSIGRFGR